ncbi:MAG: elongation factor G, partial [Acidobacteriota bacterium]
MGAFDSAELRNIGLIGHGSSGKTTLTSSLLYCTGAVNRLGRVDEGNTVTDFDPEEIDRKVSISAALAHADWQGKWLNLVDTPGAAAFVHEAAAALRIADTALSLVCGVSGIEVQTEKTWRVATAHGLSHAIAINKLDRERADFNRVLTSLQEKFGREVLPVQIPMGAEEKFRGVVDLLSMKAYLYPDEGTGKGTEAAIPAEMEEAAGVAREKLMELVAETDDQLMEKFFEKGELEEPDLVEGLRRGILEKKVIPVFALSALKGIGVDRLAEFMASSFPSPMDRETITGKVPSTDDPVTRKIEPAAPVSLFVFKTMADPFAGRISLFRVMSGTLKSDQVLQNFTRDSQEKAANLSSMQGKELIKIDQLQAGDLGCVPKLKNTTTGDTLGDPAHPILYEPITFPEGVISFAIAAKSRGDEDKLGTALARLIEEDPALSSSRDPQTHEILLSGTGVKHVEVTLAKMKKKFGVDCTLHAPKVPYRETIRKPAEALARHKKQTGGHGQFAECKIKVEPLERGAGYEFVDKIFGGAISQTYRPAVDKGIRETAVRGVVAGFPLSDFRVTLLDGKEHPVDSSEMACKIAGSLAFKECMKQAAPTLLEPIMDTEVETPEEFMGEIMGDLNSRRGRVQGMDNSGGMQIIRAKVPMAEMLTY